MKAVTKAEKVNLCTIHMSDLYNYSVFPEMGLEIRINELRRQEKKVNQIAEILGITLAKVSYVLYEKDDDSHPTRLEKRRKRYQEAHKFTPKFKHPYAPRTSN
jgi:hypothetical protein